MTGPVVVLGAGGFLGRHVVAELRGAGLAVRVPGLHAAGRLDLTGLDRAAWDDLLRGSSGVINAAGRTTGSEAELEAANVQLLSAALAAAGRAGAALVTFSSAAEYGRTEDGHAAHETDEARPLAPYGHSKLRGTQALQRAVQQGQVRAAALRLTNPLGEGAGESTLPGRAARELRQATRLGLESVRFGPLGARRDFVDARDAARVALHLLGQLRAEEPQNPQTLPDVINVGSGEARPVRDLVTGLAAQLGYHGELLEDAPGSPRSGDVPYQRADLTRLHASGFRARYSFGESLRALLHGAAPD
ncbi:NAD(P)-dependent oxidoreductase [Deinococcus sp.]|uniref:NAD-dependent epimerase/dehydratase family protein n=1 Tax=Deinococcus sp. TaxID=47478 RepID=UPI0025BEC77C|nr:NAD(P)-dependent oxidoreductase [Deinococcus sp.]